MAMFLSFQLNESTRRDRQREKERVCFTHERQINIERNDSLPPTNNQWTK